MLGGWMAQSFGCRQAIPLSQNGVLTLGTGDKVERSAESRPGDSALRLE